MKGIFGKKTVCIYLDQFAATNICDQPSSTLWSEISTLLFRAKSRGTIICPFSTESFMESSKKNIEGAQRLEKGSFILSDGWMYRHPLEVISKGISNTIRKKTGAKGVYFQQYKEGVFQHQTNYWKLKAQKDMFDNLIEKGTKAPNELRSMLRDKVPKKMVRQGLFKALYAIEVRKFTDRVDELLRSGAIVVGGEDFKEAPVPNIVDMILLKLHNNHKFTPIEFLKLKKHLEFYGLRKIPQYDIFVKLRVYFSINQIKETSNDYIDMLRVASALPTADYVFLDTAMKHKVKALGLGKRFKVKLYSGKKQDLISFRDELKDILGSAS